MPSTLNPIDGCRVPAGELPDLLLQLVNGLSWAAVLEKYEAVRPAAEEGK